MAYRTKSVCENPYDTSKYLVLYGFNLFLKKFEGGQKVWVKTSINPCNY